MRLVGYVTLTILKHFEPQLTFTNLYCILIIVIIVILTAPSFLTLSIRPYRHLLQVGPLDCIQCSHRADVWKSLPVSQYRCVHALESRLMSSSILYQRVLFVLLGWFVRWKTGGYTVAVLRGVASRIYSKQDAASLCSSHRAFPLCISLVFRCGIHTVVPTLPHLGRNPVLFYQRGQTSIWSTSCQWQSTPFLCVCWHFCRWDVVTDLCELIF